MKWKRWSEINKESTGKENDEWCNAGAKKNRKSTKEH